MLTATFDVFDVSSSAFNVGDVVALKTGGARMTVTDTTERVVCQWFDEHGELRQQAFDGAELRREPRSIPAASVRWGAVSRFSRSSVREA